MATRERNKWAEKMFSLLMREMIDPAFRFPGGGLAQRAINNCMDVLDEGAQKLSRERVVDFCICQVYAVTFYDGDYVRRWKVSHSFGRKALERFSQTNRTRKYYEDVWLAKKGLSRSALVDYLRDRSQHPLSKFIYPEYEDHTKKRQIGTEPGLYICTVSTLMWTPFSPVCSCCEKSIKCQRLTEKRYPELYRIRMEEYRKGVRHEC